MVTTEPALWAQYLAVIDGIVTSGGGGVTLNRASLQDTQGAAHVTDQEGANTPPVHNPNTSLPMEDLRVEDSNSSLSDVTLASGAKRQCSQTPRGAQRRKRQPPTIDTIADDMAMIACPLKDWATVSTSRSNNDPTVASAQTMKDRGRCIRIVEGMWKEGEIRVDVFIKASWIFQDSSSMEFFVFFTLEDLEGQTTWLKDELQCIQIVLVYSSTMLMSISVMIFIRRYGCLFALWKVVD
ncbi:hypothetical protein AMTR_s00011p00250930 [Amborella trichopoda]|uniref:Uncharacterized protein n=1 Tax=Amborella trichopoda TaxID=13333 RepID=W1NHU0_AMBTC|nr:hypothetical protein AMTR_s00011p00250930 [Amborella trichopoda]